MAVQDEFDDMKIRDEHIEVDRAMNQHEIADRYFYTPGSFEWQKPEVTQEKALAFVENLTDEEYAFLEQRITRSMDKGQEHVGAVKEHVLQVTQIGTRLAEQSGNFNQAELRLARLILLSHDLMKKPGDFNDLFTHAHSSARESNAFLARIGGEISTPETLRTKLVGETGRENHYKDLGLYMAKVIETHSAIPFIDDALSAKFNRSTSASSAQREMQPIAGITLVRRRIKGNSATIDDPSEYALPAPDPADKLATLLRAADTLSNYGIEPGLESVDPFEPLIGKYAGFRKIMMLDKGVLLEEKINNVMSQIMDAQSKGVFDGVESANQFILDSVRRMKLLHEYVRLRYEANNAEYAKKNALQKERGIFERAAMSDGSLTEQDIEHAQDEVDRTNTRNLEVYRIVFEYMEDVDTKGIPKEEAAAKADERLRGIFPTLVVETMDQKLQRLQAQSGIVKEQVTSIS